MKSVETTGKTVEDAIKAGLKSLNADSTEVNIDVLDMGSPGLFGMFGRLAKVRVTLKEEPEEEIEMPIISLSSVKPARPEKPAPRKEAPRSEQPRAEKPAPQPRAEKPAPKAEEKPAVKESESKEPVEKPARPERAPRAPKAPKAPRAEKPVQEKPIREDRPAPVVPEEQDVSELSETARRAYDFLKNVTTLMGVNVTIRIGENEGQMAIKMNGDTLGVLIGRRGETLDALQYLTSLQVNKGRDEYIRVSLDTENYRAKREDSLVKLANRMATRARKTGRRVALEPMNPYERRVLHSALQDNPYVTTHSEGEEPYRRVVITLK